MKIRIKKACIVFLLISAFSFFIGNCVFAEAEAFDEYSRPRILQDGELKIGFIHDKPEYESCARVVQQARIETAHRGWELIDLVYENEQDLRDNITVYETAPVACFTAQDLYKVFAYNTIIFTNN